MIKKLSSVPKYSNPWLSIREDTVQFDNGHIGIYGVVEKPDFVVVIPFDGSHFHLVKQYRYPIEQEQLEFPQGKHEDSPDQDPLSLAQDELQEETGFFAGNLTKIGVFHPAPGHLKQTGHVYLATDLHTGEQKLDATEADLQVVSFSEEELESLIHSGAITDGPTLVAYSMLKNRM